MARGHGHCGEILHSGPDRWSCGCQGERSNTMRNRNRARLAAILLTAVITAAASCQSEEERLDEELRNELRSIIETMEGQQREHGEVMKEHVERRNELPGKYNSTMSGLMLQQAQGTLERNQEKYESGRQEQMRVRIEETSGEELERTARELTVMADSAEMQRTVTERNISDTREKETIPPEQRMP